MTEIYLIWMTNVSITFLDNIFVHNQKHFLVAK